MCEQYCWEVNLICVLVILLGICEFELCVCEKRVVRVYSV